jgi:hypothetical protein
MSLVSQLSDVVTAIATQFKTVYGKIGDLTSLSTTAKTNLVAAINECVASISGAGATINDTGTSTSSVWSSSHTSDQITGAINGVLNGAPAALDTLKELADAIGDDADYAASTITALGNRLRFDAAQTLSSGQKTQGQANLDVYGTDDIGDPTTDFVAVFNAALA